MSRGWAAEAAGVSELSGGRTAWARNLAAPIRDFLHAETGGAVVLVGAAVAALLWANSPLDDSYESVWETRLAIALGDHELATDLREWVNEGLMTLFFLVVGLEAKRELDLGELRERHAAGDPGRGARSAAWPAPAAIYLAINAGGDGAGGWGAAMSTDTALALGALALRDAAGARSACACSCSPRRHRRPRRAAGDRARLHRARLGRRRWRSRSGCSACSSRCAGPGSWRGPAAVARRRRDLGGDVRVGHRPGDRRPRRSAWSPAPTRPRATTSSAAPSSTRSFREQPTPELAYSARASLASAISPNERLQYRLHPWTSYVIVPLFALANAGIHLDRRPAVATRSPRR